ncbi:thioredoxin-dependent thiol peroxidase [Chryseosolibacter indicus]|uniref:thioredoxin-dependent peroxiredoxin n=1 Tax=Chryseosolibacter indicus TaxID=2782351 RepID=A0ABS5VQZ1_9BACT|nr:thioredoxin-dependent thiol peroxidase [Chryseosolibacter indicus]MBT1703433.1 thioredoxin-dependent thiol peroxidase [Chryseosolibacter indicus]
MTLKVGDKAPDFHVDDQDGKPVKLSDLRGKKLVLYFYPKDMTPGCTAEACNLRDNYNSMLKKGFEVLGVSTDTEKSHKKFIDKEKLPFRLLADTDRTLHSAYGTWVEKSMYGRKYMGTARVTFIIDEKGVIEDIIEKVDTKNHTSQILKEKIDNTTKVVVKKVPIKKSATKKVTASKTAKASSKPAKKAAKKKK